MRSTFSILLLFVSLIVMAQKPAWVDGYHKDLPNSYVDVFSASANTFDEARLKAINLIVEERSRATGVRYTIKEQNGSVDITSGDNIEVKSRIIDQYQECINGNYRVSLLVQTAKNPLYSFEPVSVSDKYPFSLGVMIPGLSQINKGQITKGLVMMSGVVGCGIAAVIFENTRADYKNKMKEQPEFAKTYNTKANNNETARNVCIGAAVGFYLWNIVDGIASKGKRHVIFGNSNMAICPVANCDGGGLALIYNF